MLQNHRFPGWTPEKRVFPSFQNSLGNGGIHEKMGILTFLHHLLFFLFLALKQVCQLPSHRFDLELTRHSATFQSLELSLWLYVDVLGFYGAGVLEMGGTVLDVFDLEFALWVVSFD